MADLALNLTGLRLPSPILPASGTFGLAHGRVMDLDRLGALVPKTVTPEPRRGHPPPRLAEAAGGLVNAIGIPSPGLEPFIETVLPRYLGFAPPVIVSISADTAEEFADGVARLSQTPADGLELNLSCPNLEAGGEIFAARAASAAAVVNACRPRTSLPLWCKLTPAAGAPAEVARACEAAGADALIVGNTLPALVLAPDGGQRLANRTGGLSGPPLKPVALRLVDELARAVSVPLIGCGGVFTLADVLDYFAAGASAVAVGTATLARPSAMARLIDALDAHLDAAGLTLDALIAERRAAAARPARRPAADGPNAAALARTQTT